MRKTDKRTRRGAALIIAIAIMTVLLAIGLTFFTVARVESTTAMNVVNTVRAEHLVDAGFAMAQYQLNRDLQVHPQATSLDHAWRTMFNGAAFAGKYWATANGNGDMAAGNPAFNLELVEQKLRAATTMPVPFSGSLLYVKMDDPATNTRFTEPLFRGPNTAPWLAIPRWQGNDILLYKSQAELPLCNADGQVIADSDVNIVIAPNRIVRFDNYSFNADGTRANSNNELQYPFVTSAFFGQVASKDNLGNLIGYPFGANPLWPAEQIDAWADVDTNGDGMRDSTWVPLPKDVDLSQDGVDNDLDGVMDPVATDPVTLTTSDSEGNLRRQFEIGAFVYHIDLPTGRIVRSPDELTNPGDPASSRFALTIPLPGLKLPIDMNNDGRIDTLDCFNDIGKPDPAGSPVYVKLPGFVAVDTQFGPVQLTLADVDSLDNDYDQFVNGFSAYVYLDPEILGAIDMAFAAGVITENERLELHGYLDNSFAAAQTRGNRDINWKEVMPGVTLSSVESGIINTPPWLSDAYTASRKLPLRITLTGEPVCDVVGRAAIHVVDESSKVNMNAAGGHVYRDNIDIAAGGGEHIHRAFNEGASTYEYETRALPWMGWGTAADFWGMLTGAGYMTDPAGAKWDYSTLSVANTIPPITAIPYGPLETFYKFDVSLPGYGRVDDNMNALLLAFNGRADAGTLHPDQGLWLPPVDGIVLSVLAGIAPAALSGPQRIMYDRQRGGNSIVRTPYAEVAEALRNPGYEAYFKLLGMLEGIDEPAELQPAAPLRNLFAENDILPNPPPGNGIVGDNNNDGVKNEIGEAGDRLLANNYELQKAVDNGNNAHFGETTWPDLKNVVTANSDARTVNYIDSATGPKAINKVDPNLAPPAQLAAGLLIKGDITPATDQFYIDSAKPYKISLAETSPIRPFAEGLRQTDTTFTGYIFDQPVALPGGGQLIGRFEADPQLQAMQAAVNIADSRDADSARSLLVMDRQPTAAYQTYYEDRKAELHSLPITPPAEPLNERERVHQDDAFLVGDLQDFLINAIGGAGAEKRVVALDKWWMFQTNGGGKAEDRTISYAVAGAEAIRINEMMVRPVRRVEAEAVTHLHYDFSAHAIDPLAPRAPVYQVREDNPNGTVAAAPYANLNPTPYEGMPEFDLETVPPVFDATGTSAWNVQSYYDYPPNNPATPNRVILGDETAYRYVAPANPDWARDPADPLYRENLDIVEFRVKATDGLPAGRYYLTVNVVDPVTGQMTVDSDVDPVTGDLNEELQYTVKYMSSTAGGSGISDDLSFISTTVPDLWDNNPPLPPASLVGEKKQLLQDYFAKYWLTVDEPEYIASGDRLTNGSGAPLGWVFAPITAIDINSTTPLLDGSYPYIRDYVNGPFAGNFAQGLVGYHTSYLRDDVLPPVAPDPYGLDHPTTYRTFTVIVPDPAVSSYDTLCIAFRLKPSPLNAGRTLAINFLDFSQQPDHEYVELVNTTDHAIDLGGKLVLDTNTGDMVDDLSGWTLEVGIPDPAGMEEKPEMRDPFKSCWTIPAGSVIAPKGYLLLGFDKLDHFQAPLPDDNLFTRNGMGLAAGTATPAQDFVTEPPMAGSTTSLAPPAVSPYDPLDDLTASVFRRDISATGAATDYIDNDGDGVSSAPYVYGNPVSDPDKDTDSVSVEAKYHGGADGVVPPFARIVQLRPTKLWWKSTASPTADTSPYMAGTELISGKDLSFTPEGVKLLSELVLRGGVLPDYPEHDGHDNDGDGGYVVADTSGKEVGVNVQLYRYVRGTLDKDMVDNNFNDRIDESGRELYNLPQSNYRSHGNPFLSEGVDEGRLTSMTFLAGIRPRSYGFGSFEEGELPLCYTPSVTKYRVWEEALTNETLGTTGKINASDLLDALWKFYIPRDGFPFGDPAVNAATFSSTNLTFNPAIFEGDATDPNSQRTSPEWKSFCERRWNPGDNVIVTLYVGPSVERKVADRVTYRELDVTNRAVDDIQISPYAVDGYRDFAANSGLLYTDPITGVTTPTVLTPGPGRTPPYPNGSPDIVCLDRKRPQYWLPNQMGLDFYRSLERKHPLHAGDRFGTSNRWEATDGSYDDWADSLSLFEAADDRSQPVNSWTTYIPAPARLSATPGAQRLFQHALFGSPLRMNAQQRLWDNPPDLMALRADDPLTPVDPEGLLSGVAPTIPLDGRRLRQFVESDVVETDLQGQVENRDYALRRAEVRNRPFNSPGDLLKVPLISLSALLNVGEVEYMTPKDYTTQVRYVWRSTNAAINTRWLPVQAAPTPTNPMLSRYWRQDTALARTVLANATDTKGRGMDYAAVTELSDLNPLTLTVGQALFRPIWPNPADINSPLTFDPVKHLHWEDGRATGLPYPGDNTTSRIAQVKAPHCWSPVMMAAAFPQDTQPWSSLARWTVAYPPPLPIGQTPNATTFPTWDPPIQWRFPVDAPYLVQAEFLVNPLVSRCPIFGTLQWPDVDLRWPLFRRFPPVTNPSSVPPLEDMEYPRAVMYVSQHDSLLGEEGRAEGVFSWDAADGLENGTYIAYVATFVPRMQQSLRDADNSVITMCNRSGTLDTFPKHDDWAVMPQQDDDPITPPDPNRTDPLTQKIISLDPALPHSLGEDRFDPVLALEFVTDPTVADRVAPTRAVYSRPVAALPHPKDWFTNTTVTDINGVKTVVPAAAAYQADGDGMILYSGSGQVTWRAKLVRVTDRFLALRVRNMGRSDQVACVTGVMLAPARHTPGKINLNTVENQRIIAAETDTNYSFSIFNTLLGLPGVVDALATTRNPDPDDPQRYLGVRQGSETALGWPTEKLVPRTAGLGDIRREPWRAPLQFSGVQMPPAAPHFGQDLSADLLALKNNTGDWVGEFDGVAAMRLSAMMMAGRPEHFDGRFYESLSELAEGAGKGGTLNRLYPLSNENVPERRFDEIDKRFGRMANLITTRSDVFEILVTVQAGNTTDANGDNRTDYRGVEEFSVMAESQGRVIYERRARTDRSDEAAK